MKVSGRPVATLRRLFLRRSIPYGLFALAFGLSLSASWYLSSTAASTAESQARTEFLAHAQQIRRQIQSGLSTYVEVVRAGAVLLSADNEINGLEFRRFVEGLELPARYPGMDGIGFAQCVQRRNLRPFLRIMDLDGNPIRVWPNSVRDEHCPTVFLEPTSARNQQAIGFDLASQPVLREAMALARDTARPAVSPKLIELAVWNKGWRGNVVLLIPVFQFAAPLGTVEARRRALIGFVFSPFDSVRLLNDVLASTTSTVAVHVYDGPTPSAAGLLGQPNAPAATGLYETSEAVQVAGREWLIAVKSVGEPDGIVPQVARQTLFGGLILSLMLFFVTRAQGRAWETAARHEAELRASADALRESESQAQEANRAKDEFLATLSHELRTPSNVVLGWISILRRGPVDRERLDRALEIIDRNARHQADLIDDLLDVSRIVTGKLRLELLPLALAPIIAAVVESLRPSAEAKGVVLMAPAADESVTIRGDGDRLHQIAWNLIANAIKFTPSGGLVSVEMTSEAAHVTLTVRDSGIGIQPEFLPYAFERFMQADSSTTRTHSGVGLGLAIVRHLVELHGGTIEARSEGVGHGATFVVQIPAIAASATSATPLAVPYATAAPSSGPRLDGIRVLVVDDDPNTLELLTEALATTGAQVTASGSARDALERLRKNGVDVIVSDIAMPGEDGFWLMKHLRALPGTVGRTPAIALTALARSEDRKRAIAAGFQIHLAKPVQLEELQARVATLSARRARAH